MTLVLVMAVLLGVVGAFVAFPLLRPALPPAGADPAMSPKKGAKGS